MHTLIKNLKKIRYLDNSKSRFVITMVVIVLFCFFVGGTYAFFHISSKLNSSIITIANLKYQLTSSDEKFQNNSVQVGAGETLEITLDLKSLNSEETRYALDYFSESSDVKVYYKDQKEQNVEGVIGTLNSIININIVIENKSSSPQNVTFEFKGGYSHNILNSNIVDRFIISTEKTVKVTWNMINENRVRPDSLDIGIYKSGELYDTVTLNDANEWQYTWTDLDSQYEWTIPKVNLSGFDALVEEENDNVILMNIYTAKDIIIMIEWDTTEEHVSEKTIVATITGPNGYNETKEYTLNNLNSWTYTEENFNDAFVLTVDSVSAAINGFLSNITSEETDESVIFKIIYSSVGEPPEPELPEPIVPPEPDIPE